MNFDFSEEQKIFKAQVRKALERACPLSETRRILENSEAYSKGAWRALCELGAPAAAIPEAYGGLGLGYYELCLAAEEAGRALAPTPFSSSIFLGAEALIEAGSHDQKAAWLPAIASGDSIACFADCGVAGLLPALEGGRLRGVSRPVADGGCADVAVVLARRAPAGVGLVLVRLDQPGVSRRVLNSVDPSRDVAELSFHDAVAEPLGDHPMNAGLIDRIRQRAAILIAFEQVGGAERALYLARDYALERKAFGRPIGTYQAIKHKLANVYIKLEMARAHAHYGAWALSTRAADLPAAAAAARVTATEAFSFAAQESLQTHGGMGFTWDGDCQLFYRRSRLLALQLGSMLIWKEAVVNELELTN
jgi:acyl-CoA dehydrogenase